MGKDAVDELVLSDLGKTFYRITAVLNEMGTDIYVSQKLPGVGLVVRGETIQFKYLPGVMQHRRRNEKITVQIWIMLREEITDLRNGEGMFKKSAHKAVMNGLCGAVLLKLRCEIRIVIERKQKLLEIRCRDAVYYLKHFSEHSGDVLFRGGHIISLIDC